MKLFVVGAPCSGKSTVVGCLRDVHGLNALDTDDEILRLNAGVWPSDNETKNEVLLPRVLKDAIQMEHVVLFNSYLFVDHAILLRRAGFRILLLDVPEEELRRRDAARLAIEGWTNIEWFDWHQSVIQELRANRLIDYEVSGDQQAESVATDIVRYGKETFSEQVSQ